MRFRSLLFGALGVTLVAIPSVARANGRFPAANQLVAQPTDPGHLLLRTTFGLVASRDTGANWDWLCEDAVGYGGTEDPSMAITSDGSFVAGTFEGVSVSHDDGCGWAFAGGGLEKNVIVDVVVRPDAPSTAFVLTNKYTNADDAGNSLFRSDIYVSTDDGKTWTTAGPSLDPTILFETIEVAASDPQRLYLSGTRGASGAQKAVMLVSTDRGATWTEHEVPLDVSVERAAFISAVDPKNADRVYVRTKLVPQSTDAGTAGSRLLVTDDAGKTYREVLKLTSDMLGFALSPDGGKVWAGSAKDGLYFASTADLSFSKKSPIAIQCLTANGGTLYACSSEVSGFILGASEDDGATFAPKLHIWGIRGPLACGAGSNAAQCAAKWPSIRDGLGTPPSDGGASDGATTDGGATGPKSSGGCSCDTTSSTGGAAFGFALTGLGLAALLRRTRRR